MKNLLASIILLVLFYNIAESKEIELIVPNALGSAADILGKDIAAKYEEITGKKVTIKYLPGGEGAVAASYFQRAHNQTMMIATSSMIIYNPVLKQNLSYKDEDFKFYAWLASLPCIYVTRTDTGIKTIEDFITKLPKSKKPFVAGYGPSCDLNVDILNKSGKSSGLLEVVKYKSGPDTLLALLNGDVDVANINIQANLFQLVNEGKLHIIATSSALELDVEGKKIISMSSALQIPYTISGNMLIIKPNADPAFEKSLQDNLKKIMYSDKLQKSMKQIFAVNSNIYGEKDTLDFIKDFRKKVRDNFTDTSN
jgi:tripartite-type tricarboxylate transporter receptor subunit TctC